eukprot:scaffold101732_cov35-Phaeocystis_antarctica.AAC.2
MAHLARRAVNVPFTSVLPAGNVHPLLPAVNPRCALVMRRQSADFKLGDFESVCVGARLDSSAGLAHAAFGPCAYTLSARTRTPPSARRSLSPVPPCASRTQSSLGAPNACAQAVMCPPMR